MWLLSLPLLIPLPLLLIASAFFSGSETALFGLTQSELLAMRREDHLSGHLAIRLIEQPRMLLITVLIGNMTVNVLYFVLSSTLLLNLSDAGVHPLSLVALPPVALLAIILAGEVLPKLIANIDRRRWIRITVIPLYFLHQLLGPLRAAVNVAVLEPLTRITAPGATTDQLSVDELGELLRQHVEQGVIDRDEERLLSEVLALSRLKVSNIMTPRTEIRALRSGAGRDDVLSFAGQTGFTRAPVYNQSLDEIVGFLHLKPYLCRGDERSAEDAALPPVYVPEVASVEALLDVLHHAGASMAIAVDEFGGTAGLVTIEQAIGTLVGVEKVDASDGEVTALPTEVIDETTWRVSGRLPVRAWRGIIGTDAIPAGVSTIGGLVVSRLGRLPVVGDTARVGNVLLRVDAADGVRIERVTVHLGEAPATKGEEPP
jgi:putative hemolysin